MISVDTESRERKTIYKSFAACVLFSCVVVETSVAKYNHKILLGRLYFVCKGKVTAEITVGVSCDIKHKIISVLPLFSGFFTIDLDTPEHQTESL